MKTLKIVVVAIIIAAQAVVTAQNTNNFDQVFEKWSDNNVEPGVSVAILKDDKVVYKTSHGFSNLEHKLPLSSMSIYDMGSLAKQFTGFAIAKLTLEGKMSLEDEVSMFFPDLKLQDENLKIKHLVYHTSGLRDIGDLYHLAPFGEHLTGSTALEIIKRQKKLNTDVGTEYAYSNTNYVLLALTVEKLSGKSFGEWCEENIFRPLQMNDTFVNEDPSSIINNRVMAYNPTQNGFSYNQSNGMALIGSSAVYSNVEDMIKWANAVQSEAQFKDIFQLMKKEGKTDAGENVGYGFGLALYNHIGFSNVEHSGATPSGFRSLITWIPEEKLSMIFLSNGGHINLHEYKDKILGMLVRPKVGANNRPNPDGSFKPVKLPVKELEKFTGQYLFDFNQKVEISLEGGKLLISPDGHNKMELVAIGNDEVWFPAFQSIFKFKFDNNKFREAHIKQGNRTAGQLVKLNPKDFDEIDMEIYEGTYYCSELELFFDLRKSSDNGTLSLYNAKHGNVKLHKRTNKIFVPEKPIATSIVFNESGNMGFNLNKSDKIKNLEFVRLTKKPL